MTERPPADTEALRVIGANVRAERARQRLSQEELAEASTVQVAQVSRIERGVTDTSILKLVAIAKALDVQVADLLRGL